MSIQDKNERIRVANVTEHDVSLQLEYRGYTTIHPPKSITGSYTLDPYEFRDTVDFFFYKENKGLRGAMVKTFKGLNAYKVNDNDIETTRKDLLLDNAYKHVLIDPVSKWEDKEMIDKWWDQRVWFCCDKTLTFAMVFNGQDRDTWIKQPRQMPWESHRQDWWAAPLTDKTVFLDLTREHEHSRAVDVDLEGMANSLKSFKI